MQAWPSPLRGGSRVRARVQTDPFPKLFISDRWRDSNRMALDFSAKALPVDDVIYREIDDEAVLLHIRKGLYLGLNETGRFFWSVLRAASSLEEACREVEAHYDVTSGQLREDVAQFVEDLLEQGLVRLEGSTDRP